MELPQWTVIGVILLVGGSVLGNPALLIGGVVVLCLVGANLL